MEAIEKSAAFPDIDIDLLDKEHALELSHKKRGRKKGAAHSDERDIQKLAIKFIEEPSELNFLKLSKRINWGLRKYIFDIVKSNDYIDEIVNKTLENIYFKRDQFDPAIANFSTWMYKIAFNNSLKFLNDQKKIHKYHISEDFSDIYESEISDNNMEDCCDDSSNTSAGYTAANNEFVDMIINGTDIDIYDKERIFSEIYDASIDCISYLPDNLRIVMKERLLNNKKIDDIAADNRIPVSSVKNWLRKGKVALAETVKERYANLYNMYMFGQAF